MSYYFTRYKPPDEGPESGFGLNNWQMTYVRLVMLEAGAIAGSLIPALRTAGLEPTEQSLPTRTFMSNDGAHVTAAGAAFIAVRLRQAIDKDVVSDLLSFYDDAPDSDDVTKWVKEFADFNERAAGHDGYFVC